MTTRRILAKALFGAALAATVGSIAAAQPMPPYPPGWQPMPPPRYEPVPPPPGAAYVWVPGHWRWNGYRYIWVGGRYVVRQTGWHRWVDGRWVIINGRWTWIPAHWA
jgi:hypothetical protein